jgi:hypothetical protein
MTNAGADQLARHIGETLELRFVDGEVVEAALLSVDPVEHMDIEYEVRRILAPSSIRGYAVEVGGTYVGKLKDLASWALL